MAEILGGKRPFHKTYPNIPSEYVVSVFKNMEKKRFIKCPACKERSFIRIMKEFDGFKVSNEKKTCALCGYEFRSDEEIEYIEEKPLFKDEGEEKRFCRDCQHYVVHPWTQICGLTKKEVIALDTCQEFVRKEI